MFKHYLWDLPDLRLAGGLTMWTQLSPAVFVRSLLMDKKHVHENNPSTQHACVFEITQRAFFSWVSWLQWSRGSLSLPTTGSFVSWSKKRKTLQWCSFVALRLTGEALKGHVFEQSWMQVWRTLQTSLHYLAFTLSSSFPPLLYFSKVSSF